MRTNTVTLTGQLRRALSALVVAGAVLAATGATAQSQTLSMD